MTDDTPRTPDMCDQCGTPYEIAEADESPEEEAATSLVLRCANGHEKHVTRHEAPDAA